MDPDRYQASSGIQIQNKNPYWIYYALYVEIRIRILAKSGIRVHNKQGRIQVFPPPPHPSKHLAMPLPPPPHLQNVTKIGGGGA